MRQVELVAQACLCHAGCYLRLPCDLSAILEGPPICLQPGADVLLEDASKTGSSSYSRNAGKAALSPDLGTGELCWGTSSTACQALDQAVLAYN